jgi:hypothetical protein
VSERSQQNSACRENHNEDGWLLEWVLSITMMLLDEV